jgi:hypothetical protein
MEKIISLVISFIIINSLQLVTTFNLRVNILA